MNTCAARKNVSTIFVCMLSKCDIDTFEPFHGSTWLWKDTCPTLFHASVCMASTLHEYLYILKECFCGFHVYAFDLWYRYIRLNSCMASALNEYARRSKECLYGFRAYAFETWCRYIRAFSYIHGALKRYMPYLFHASTCMASILHEYLYSLKECFCGLLCVCV